MAGTERRLAGVLGFYKDSHSLMEGMKKVRAANYKAIDAFTPFPVHGLEHAQGLKRSPLPYVTFAAGLTGFTCAVALQYWTSAVDWPLIVGGKPLWSWPAFVPIMFELTVLFGALATVGAMFLINGLPNQRRKAFDPSLTRDRFAIVIEAPHKAHHGHGDEDEEEDLKADRFKPFDEREVTSFLKQAGADEVRSVYAEGWF
jgi:hypothetical protein